MKTAALILSILMLAVVALAQGYDSMPVDALIVPIGFEGTAYSDMEFGVRGGTFNVARSEDPKAWNANTVHETSTSWFTARMHRGLLGRDHVTGAIVVDFAKGYEISEDGLTLVFFLREGTRWSDGTLITADDVVFTYNDVILNEDIDCNARDGQILPDGTFPVCEKVNDHTVTFTLSTSYRPILNSLVFPIMPKHKLAEFVHKLNPSVPPGTFNETWTLDTPLNELVGNGPWIVTDYQANVSVTMDRNPYYYGYDPTGTQLPYYNRLVVSIVANQDVSMLKFLNAEIDVYQLRPEDIPILLTEAGAKRFTVMVTGLMVYGTRWFMINQDIGLAEGTLEAKRDMYRNVEFREALAYLLDKASMIQNVFNGLALPQWSPVSMPSPFYAGRDYYGGPITESDVVRFKHDPSLAASKLDTLGVVDQDGDGWRDLPNGDPLMIEINTNDNTIGVGICQIYQDDLRAVGLNAIFQIVDFNTLVDRLFSSTVDIIALGLTGDDEPNNGKNVYRSCGSLHAYRFSACEEPDKTDLRIDQLLDLGASTFDLDEAFGYYKEYQQLISRQLGYVFSVAQTFTYAYYNHVGNAFKSSPTSVASGNSGRLNEVCFDKRLK